MHSSIAKSIISVKNDPQGNKLVHRTNFKWVVNDGESVFFWEDRWLTEYELSSVFPFLYSKVSRKHILVKEFLQSWHQDQKSANLWSHDFTTAGEVEFNSLVDLLAGLSLKGKADQLIWPPQ